jgi:hypothetical protein
MLKRVNKEIENLKLIYQDTDFNLKKISEKEYDLECNFPSNRLNINLDIPSFKTLEELYERINKKN